MPTVSKHVSRHVLQGYLDQHSDQSQFTLVGPLAEKNRQFSDPVIFVDGGSIRREGEVGIVVGDGDSSDIQMDLELDPYKDFSDLSFALGLLPDSVTRVILSGFLGGRRDHELFNFGEVFHFLNMRSSSTAVLFDSAVIALTNGQWQLEIEGLFSLMAIENTRISLGGACHYPIDPAQQVKPLSSFGLSNVGEGLVSIDASKPVFVLSDNVAAFRASHQD